MVGVAQGSHTFAGPATGVRTIETGGQQSGSARTFFYPGMWPGPRKGDFAGLFFRLGAKTAQPCPLCRRPL